MPGVAIAPRLKPLLDVGRDPGQPSEPVPPLAVQDVASVVLHFSVSESPG